MRPTRLVLVLCFAGGLLLQAAGSAPAPALQASFDRIGAMAAAELAKDQVAGVTIGVVSGADLVWTGSYGMADMERKVPASRTSVYRIGSITKQFTAVMLLQLIRDGKAKLSDPVETHLPEINTVKGRLAGAPAITLGQLATMTSGLAREPANLPSHLVGPVSQWEQVLLEALPETTYAHEPDTRYLYSNIGYGILGAALGRAAGTPYAAYVQRRILAPLGMMHTAFEPNATIQPHLTVGYAVDRSGNVSAEASTREHAGRGYKVPNGAIYTTVDDLARFVAFELGEGPESVLSRTALADNYSRVNSSSGDLTSGYGVGFQLSRHGDRVYVGHGGSVAGYTAQAWLHRPSKIGVIALRNAGGGKFDLSELTFRALAELTAQPGGSGR